MPIQKLPDSEWNFSNIEPSLISYAFFYEYSRQSEKVRTLVEEYRSLLPYGVDHDLEHGWIFSSDKLELLSEDEESDLWQCTKQFKEDSYLELIVWLSACDEFPDHSFADLSREDCLNSNILSNYQKLPVNGRGLCDHGFCWEKDYCAVEDNFVLNLNLGLGGLQAMDCSDDNSNHAAVHRLRVDWWKTNSELKQEFSKWVDTYRKHLKVEPVKASSRGFLNRPLDLPDECKKKSTALTHLGTLRCLEFAGSWNNFLNLYEKTNRRYLEKDVSAARKILAWLEAKV